MLITGAGGQLGRALVEEFPEALALTRAEWDVTLPAPGSSRPPDLVLHAAAWTDVDGAEDDPQGAAAVNVGGTANVAALGAPLVYYSSDYVFDGRKREPYVESDGPNPVSAYGRSKLHGEAAAGEGRGSSAARGSSARPGTTSCGRCSGSARSATRSRSSTTSAARRRTSAHLAAATRELLERPPGIWHVAAEGDCTWAEFAEAIFEEAGLDCRVRPIATAELGRPAPRPAYSVLRSEKGAPTLPHWRDGLRECLARLA